MTETVKKSVKFEIYYNEKTQLQFPAFIWANLFLWDDDPPLILYVIEKERFCAKIFAHKLPANPIPFI